MCSICGEKFEEIDDLATHNKTKHPRTRKTNATNATVMPSKKLKCEYPNLQFKTKEAEISQNSAYDEDKDQCQEEFTCSVCEKQFTSAEAYSEHQEVEHQGTDDPESILPDY